MSRSDTIRDLFKLSADQAIDATLAAYDEDVEVWPSTGPGPLRGRDAVRRFWEEQLSDGVSVQARLHEVTALENPDQYIAAGRVVVRRPGGGTSDSPVCWLFEFGEQGVRRVSSHRTRAQAMAAAEAAAPMPG